MHVISNNFSMFAGYVIFLVAFSFTSCFASPTGNFASKSGDRRLNLWDLAVFKRNLQLQGVLPIVVKQNGIMVRMYLNQKAESASDTLRQTPPTNEPHLTKNQMPSYRRGRNMRHFDLNQEQIPAPDAEKKTMGIGERLKRLLKSSSLAKLFPKNPTLGSRSAFGRSLAFNFKNSTQPTMIKQSTVTTPMPRVESTLIEKKTIKSIRTETPKIEFPSNVIESTMKTNQQVQEIEPTGTTQILYTGSLAVETTEPEQNHDSTEINISTTERYILRTSTSEDIESSTKQNYSIDSTSKLNVNTGSNQKCMLLEENNFTFQVTGIGNLEKFATTESYGISTTQRNEEHDVLVTSSMTEANVNIETDFEFTTSVMTLISTTTEKAIDFETTTRAEISQTNEVATDLSNSELTTEAWNFRGTKDKTEEMISIETARDYIQITTPFPIATESTTIFVPKTTDPNWATTPLTEAETETTEQQEIPDYPEISSTTEFITENLQNFTTNEMNSISTTTEMNFNYYEQTVETTTFYGTSVPDLTTDSLPVDISLEVQLTSTEAPSESVWLHSEEIRTGIPQNPQRITSRLGNSGQKWTTEFPGDHGLVPPASMQTRAEDDAKQIKGIDDYDASVKPNPDEVTDSMDYLSDDGTVTEKVPKTIGDMIDMSYFSDKITHRFDDEYKMDQSALFSIHQNELNQFSGSELQVLRSLFHRKWNEIGKEVEELEYIGNDDDPILMEISNKGE